ncbi:hypothetical protein B0T25DRAFT_563380 [Lasiosphaeria hispida]|uniref:Uncharacterized protein n=1 Tax=Lasiosphaeria hispida TaxID=260671 RepID=A0AAJ0HX83_9PEZI|nr:hypothetical protein B0T25DRAFT_563380 [Lasiosphaeria hispida]
MWLVAAFHGYSNELGDEELLLARVFYKRATRTSPATCSTGGRRPARRDGSRTRRQPPPPVIQEGEHDDEFPSTPDIDRLSPQSLIIQITANGACDIRACDQTLFLQLIDQVTIAIRTAAEAGAAAANSRALKAKSRAFRNIAVPVLAAATVVFIWLTGGRSAFHRQ